MENFQESERLAFEAHMTDNGQYPRAVERNSDGGYRLMATASAWNIWRAAYDSFAQRAASVPAQAGQQPTLLAYAATDLDGRVDVGMTPEKAKERAGNGCTTVFGLYDLGTSVPAASVQPDPLEQFLKDGGLHGLDSETAKPSYQELLDTLQQVTTEREEARGANHKLRAQIAAQQPDIGRDAALVADNTRQDEAHKLARILLGMVEGGGCAEGADIYAEGYSAPDGDVYVVRAAELLIEQAAESKELTRYVEHFALATQAAPEVASVPDAGKCAHAHKTHGHDNVQCIDCGAFRADTEADWGVAAGKWFASEAEALFYKLHGVLPGNPATRQQPAPAVLSDEQIVEIAGEVFNFKHWKSDEENKAKYPAFFRAVLAAARANKEA